MVGAPGSLDLAPLRGSTVDTLQLSGSHSYTSCNASQGANYEQGVSKKKEGFLALLRTWKGSYHFN
jgi:hypothetical protein